MKSQSLSFFAILAVLMLILLRQKWLAFLKMNLKSTTPFSSVTGSDYFNSLLDMPLSTFGGLSLESFVMR